MRAHHGDTLGEKQANRAYQRLPSMYQEGAPDATANAAPGPPASTDPFAQWR